MHACVQTVEDTTLCCSLQVLVTSTPRTHARTHARIHTHTHTCRHVHTHAHMHACTHAHMHTCAHAQMYTCTHTRMHTNTRTHTHTHTERERERENIPWSTVTASGPFLTVTDKCVTLKSTLMHFVGVFLGRNISSVTSFRVCACASEGACGCVSATGREREEGRVDGCEGAWVVGCVCVRAYLCVRACMHAHVLVRVRVNLVRRVQDVMGHTQTHMHTHTHTYTHTHVTHTHTCVQTY